MTYFVWIRRQHYSRRLLDTTSTANDSRPLLTRFGHILTLPWVMVVILRSSNIRCYICDAAQLQFYRRSRKPSPGILSSLDQATIFLYFVQVIIVRYISSGSLNAVSFKEEKHSDMTFIILELYNAFYWKSWDVQWLLYWTTVQRVLMVWLMSDDIRIKRMGSVEVWIVWMLR